MIKNIFWNFVGNIFSIIINIGLIPIYINYLGVEEFGIISILGTLNSIFVILDLGLGLSTNREIARMSALNETTENFSNTVRTIEFVSFATAIIIFLFILFFSDFISSRWLVSSKLSKNSINHSIQLLGLIIMFRWPISFYSNVLFGFQRIELLNLIKICFFIFQGVGTLFLLIYCNVKLTSFLNFLIALYFLNLIVIAFFVWKIKVLHFVRGKFRKQILIRIKKYTVGLSVLSLFGVFFPILDKLFVSKFFSLEIFGFYSIITMIGLGVTQLIYPITSALFPRYTGLYVKNKLIASYYEFRFSFQLVGTLIISFISVFLLFSKDILLAWTNSDTLYDNINIILLPFFIGIYFYSFQIIPSLCLTATGSTKRININFFVVTSIYFFLLSFSSSLNKIELISYSWMIANILLFVLNFISVKKIIFRVSLFKLLFCDVIVPTTVAIILILILRSIEFKLYNSSILIFILQLGFTFLIFFSILTQFNFLLKKTLKVKLSNYVRDIRNSK